MNRYATAMMLSLAGVFLLAGTGLCGSGFGPGPGCKNRNGCSYYVDKNGDGMCDYTGVNFIDEDGDGMCDNRSFNPDPSGQGRGWICRMNQLSRGRSISRPPLSDNQTGVPGGYGMGGFCWAGVPPAAILEGTPFAYSGEVLSIGRRGTGLVLATADGNVTVYGMGPYWYWVDCIGSAYPQAGNTIDVTGYTIDYNGIQRNIALTVNGITLRDPDSGYPLWRGGRRNGCQD